MTAELRFGSKVAGDGHPTYVIAEACVNHNGDFATAIALIDAAADAGADAVKFQLHYPQHEMLPVVPASDNFAKPLIEILRDTHLTEEQHAQLMRHCEKRGVLYLCTAYCREASDTLAGMGMELFKIGSGETLNHPLLRWVARNDRPMLVATGMTELDEVDATVAVLRETGVEFGLMHCTSEYPPVYEDINLDMIKLYQERYRVVVGHSDHSPDINTALASVALGAHIVEKHFTLTRDQPGPDHPVSIEPSELTALVRGIRIIEQARGSQKAVFEREKPIRAWAHHSVVTIKPVASGEPLTLENTWVKRPGIGIPARDLETVLGRRVARDLPADVLVGVDDLT